MSRKSGKHDYSLLFDHGLDLDARTIYPDTQTDDDGLVNRDMALTVIKGLSILSQISAVSPIYIILNSPGGDVSQGFAIYDYIKQLPNEVIVTVYGEAYSMAVAILQAGDIRRMSPRSTLLLHDGNDAVSGYNRKTLQAWHEMGKTWDAWYDAIILSSLKEKDPTFSKQKLQGWMQSDKLITAAQALELGLIDEVVQEMVHANKK